MSNTEIEVFSSEFGQQNLDSSSIPSDIKHAEVNPSNTHYDWHKIISSYAPHFRRRHPVLSDRDFRNHYYLKTSSQRIIQDTFNRRKDAIATPGATCPTHFLAPSTILESNKNILAIAGGGVTYEMLKSAHHAIDNHLYLPIYLDLMCLESGLYSSLQEECEAQIECLTSAGLLDGFGPLLYDGMFLFLFDNLDRISVLSQNISRRFIESISSYGLNRILVGTHQSRAAFALINSGFCLDLPGFSAIEIAPWDEDHTSIYLNLDQYPKHFASRVLSQPRQPDFCCYIDDIHHCLEIPPTNLALVYEHYLRVPLKRLQYFLPMEITQLELLLSLIADTREIDMLFSLEEWLPLVDGILQRKNLSLPPSAKFNKAIGHGELNSPSGAFNPSEVILQSLIKSGIVEFKTFKTFGWRDLSFQHFLLAKSYVSRGCRLRFFDKAFVEDPEWQPVLVFYLELQSYDDIPQVGADLLELPKAYGIPPHKTENMVRVINEILEIHEAT